MAEEQKQGKNKTIIIIIAALLVLLIGLGAAFYFLTKPAEEEKPQAGAEQQAAATQDATQEVTQTNSKYIRIGSVFKLDQFIVNLINQGGKRYLKINISLEMTLPTLENELTAKSAPIRDIVIDVLSSKSVEEIQSSRGREKAKEEIAQRLNEILVDGKIRNVFFQDWAIQ